MTITYTEILAKVAEGFTPVLDAAKADGGDVVAFARSEAEALAEFKARFEPDAEVVGVTHEDIEVPDTAGYYSGNRGHYSLIVCYAPELRWSEAE